MSSSVGSLGCFSSSAPTTTIVANTPATRIHQRLTIIQSRLRDWILRHEIEHRRILQILHQILYWWPTNSLSSHSSTSRYQTRLHRWREALWGLIELDFLFLDLMAFTATSTRTTTSSSSSLSPGYENDDDGRHSFGTTLAIRPHPTFPTRGLRLALTVLQHVGPILQQLLLVYSFSSPQKQQQQQDQASFRFLARFRCHMERIRFLLRSTLLLGYWYQINQFNKNQAAASIHYHTSPLAATTRRPMDILPGIFLQGGRYLPTSPFSAHMMPTVEEEARRRQRASYVGPRTGRRLVVTSTWSGSSHDDPGQDVSSHRAKLFLGEILYIFRPIFQAEVEYRVQHSETRHDEKNDLWMAWWMALAVDMASLWMLQDHGRVGQDPPRRLAMAPGEMAYQEEWKRRRLRLMLYLLRSPVWDMYSRPLTGKVTSILDRIPILGPLTTTYLWDWLHYWKLYRAEEG